METMLWYKGWVRNPAGLASSPAGEKLTPSQPIFWKRLPNNKWLVFDGEALYLILPTEQARLALKSSRDARQQPVPAEDQATVEAHFRQAVQRKRG
jgi:hypothetical protein